MGAGPSVPYQYWRSVGGPDATSRAGHRGPRWLEPSEAQRLEGELTTGYAAWDLGRVTSNIEPCPGSLETRISPPWASTMFRTIQSPSPNPP